MDEAITPQTWVSDDGIPPAIPPVDDGEPTLGVVLSVPGAIELRGENDEYVQIEHYDALELTEGTVALAFTADDVSGWNALFSKDAHGQETGGHLTAFVVDGKVKVRLQSTEHNKWLHTAEESIQAGQEYHIVISFGAEGFHLYLNGELADSNDGFTQGIAMNTEELAIGANIWSRSEENPLYAKNEFAGVISDFTVYSDQLSPQEIPPLAGDPAFLASGGTEEVDQAFAEFAE